MHGTPDRAAGRRTWSRILMTFVLAGALAACGGDDDSESGSAMNDGSPPEDDVEIESCEPNDSGNIDVVLAVTNHASEAASYVITLGFEDDSGAEVGTGLASADGVGVGETVQVDGFGAVSIDPGDAHCIVEKVERFRA